MPDFGNTSVFSQTDGSNNSGTQPSWSGSANPNTIDDAGRALQGAVTREWNWRSFTITAGGTDNAKTLTYSVAPAAYYNGQRFAFIANTTNTGSATLNVNALGAKTIRSMVTGALANLVSGDMVSGTYVEVAYNTANDCFVWVNQRASLSAASDSASGIVELATTTETLTGTDTARAVTPDALAALWERGADVASAGTISLGEGGYFVITGTTTITDIDFATDRAGRPAWVRFSGALTLTHGASLILPGGANITTAAGDTACFVSEGSDVVRCTVYTRANGQPIVTTGGMTLLGTIATTSGTNPTLSALTLTGYKQLQLVFQGVSHDAGASRNILVGNSTADDVAFTAGVLAAADTARGIVTIDLTNGTFFGAVWNVGVNASSAPNSIVGDCAITTASTAVSIALDGTGNFDAGSILVYGIA